MNKPEQLEQAPDPQVLFIEYLEARQLGQEARAERLLEELARVAGGPVKPLSNYPKTGWVVTQDS